eukprot:comp18251_c0_seq1/m.19235 comp18251_c0_seq1/g.19235  ORF comp18251_c0_seq1/g.19235 comp18251_c0_seq1/m.19235 type:complete len:379 (-) comp18251_c0_seq1:616-1752(-)
MMVDVHLILGRCYVWTAEEVLYLRKNHRIIAEPTGTLPTSRRQNLLLGLPAVLMEEQAAVLLRNGYALLLDGGSLGSMPVTEEDINIFTQTRIAEFAKQNEEYEKRKEVLRGQYVATGASSSTGKTKAKPGKIENGVEETGEHTRHCAKPENNSTDPTIAKTCIGESGRLESPTSTSFFPAGTTTQSATRNETPGSSFPAADRTCNGISEITGNPNPASVSPSVGGVSTDTSSIAKVPAASASKREIRSSFGFRGKHDRKTENAENKGTSVGGKPGYPIDSGFEGAFVVIERLPQLRPATTLPPSHLPFPNTPEERDRLRVFEHLWSLGYYLTPGLRFGGHYLVYHGKYTISNKAFGYCLTNSYAMAHQVYHRWLQAI